MCVCVCVCVCVPLAADAASAVDGIEQLVRARRDLCQVLNREMGFQRATTHGYMQEIVRLSKCERQIIENLDRILSEMDIYLL